MAKTPEKKFSARALKSWATRRKNAKKARKLGDQPSPMGTLSTKGTGPKTTRFRSEAGNMEQDFSFEKGGGMLTMPVTGTDSPDHTSTFTKGGGRVSSLYLTQIAAEIQGMDLIQAEAKLQEMVCRATADQEIISRRQMLEQRKALDEHIVCAWLAEVDYAMQAGNGGLRNDEAWVLNSLLVTKIVDALNAAGYTAKGRRRT